MDSMDEEKTADGVVIYGQSGVSSKGYFIVLPDFLYI